MVKFFYNERGQRIKKESYNTSTFALNSTDYYILDLSGNAMAIYNQPVSSAITQKDLPIFGLSRLGVCNRTGISNYEITDHLGNVRAVIQKLSGNPVIKSFADYYPFGEQLVGRSVTNDYRYAFQGQELDTETGMEAFQLRLWDGRIGRWLSPDPMGQYASPYLGMGNNPISGIDSDGGLWIKDKNGNVIAQPGDDIESYAKFMNISIDEASMAFSQNFRVDNAVMSGGEIFRNNPFSNTTTWLSEIVVSKSKFSFDSDLAFNVIGTAGDAGEALVYGRRYFQDNVFVDYNKAFKGIGLVGDAYDVANGSYVLYNSNTRNELISNGTSLGLDLVMIKVGQKYPLAAAAYGVVKIIGDSDVYHKAQHDASRESYYKKHGFYPDGVNHTATLRQDSGMYKECATCPLKFRF